MVFSQWNNFVPMRLSEYEKITKIYEDREIKKPVKSFDNIYKDPTFTPSYLKIAMIKKNIPSKEPLPKENKIFQTIISSISKAHKNFIQNFNNIIGNHRKISAICSREIKRALSKTSRTNPILKTKRINKEVNKYISKLNRGEREKIKKEDAAIEQKKKHEMIQKEELRQKRKFAYLMSQTEAFANFVLKKKVPQPEENNEEDFETSLNGMAAAKEHMKHIQEFDNSHKRQKVDEEKEPNEFEGYEHKDIEQPKILKTSLKSYQLKGLNWLVNLYNQGINGILADDMGLGKTVQAISFLGYLAETEDIWGPFLVITPASTLHNWQNEFYKFIPEFKILTYYGNIQERSELRKRFKKVNVIITSYQVAVTDETYLKKISWQYMILDEAQAIKSINSQRWNTLLAFKSRNRCLLTGTPIQNNLQELWSLLHFIMPTLFDSLSEFNEWFVTENKVDENQISKLHTILKPFMLRRHKNDIKDEIGTKEMVVITCDLSRRQRALYDEVMNSNISWKDADYNENKGKTNSNKTGDCENKIMQLKKICNHPNLFEKQEPHSAFSYTIEGDRELIEPSNAIKKYINAERYKFLSNQDSCIIEPNKIRKILSNDLFLRLKPQERKIPFDILSDIRIKKRKLEIDLKRQEFYNEKILNFRYDRNNVEATIDKMNRFISVPPISDFISDSGKLYQLDILLKKLKAEGHRPLVYFQMTKMMDMFEEYLVKMEYSYLRLDGTSKVSSRADLVHEWQNKDIFIFILSTRAGGVGINLTAADTVIFYDSDWNPTVDQQAMDRVHRLGQTKKVTVYRLVTRDSVEELIMERASEKNEMQSIVIKGNIFQGFH